MDADQARQRIVTEKERLEGLVRDREAEGYGTESETEQVSELSSRAQHPADLGTETFERERDFSLLEALSAEIGDLDTALRKVEDGCYGICEACRHPIPAERLEAVPGTRFCVEHAAR